MAFSPNLRNRFLPEKMSYKIGLMCGIGMRLRFRLMGMTPPIIWSGCCAADLQVMPQDYANIRILL